MDASTLEQLNSLLGKTNSGSSGGSLFDINAIIQPLMPYLIAISIASILITLLYLISIIDKWRSNRAILEIRKVLREMNDRDKLRDNLAHASLQRPAQDTSSETSSTSAPTTPPGVSL